MKIKGRPQSLTTESLREPVVTLVPTSTYNTATGNTTVTFAIVDTIWGMYLPENQNRNDEQMQVTFIISARVYIRYGITINDTYKLRIRGSDYTIHSIVDVDNRHEFYEIILRG